MAFKRTWDSTCPRVYDTWEADDVTWVIQDMPPEADEEAVQLLAENMCTDEALCSLSGMVNDPVSMRSACDLWRKYLSLRMSLACYAEVGGKRTLAALNVCYVKCDGDIFEDKVEGVAWQNVFSIFAFTDENVDPFKHLGLDKLLLGVGLVVRKDYRGHRLGAKLLAAREPLCKHLGIKGSSTVFSGPASQRSAARCGFNTIFTVAIKDLSNHGFNYPTDDDRLVKVMVKKYE